MNKKTIGIFVVMLLIAYAVLPAMGIIGNDNFFKERFNDYDNSPQQICNECCLLPDWTEEDKLIAAFDGQPDDSFGNSVSIDGDYAIVGAYLDDTIMGVNSGSAYIFKRTTSGWIEDAKLIAAFDGKPDDYFGYSVSIDGDYAIVGAWGADYLYTSFGSAYIFKRTISGWIEDAKLNAVSNYQLVRYFGYSVSIDGDYAIIGSHGDHQIGNQAGSAYIFKRTISGWIEDAKLIAAFDGQPDDLFGYSVSIDGDYAIVGAHADDTIKGVNSGSAYIFERTATQGWIEDDKLIAAFDGQPDDYFGWSVSIDGDYSIVGAPWDDTIKGVNSGSAYIFERTATQGWIEDDKLIAAFDGIPHAYFGISVSIDGDYAIVGAHADDTIKGVNSGSAYIFERTATQGWIEDDKLIAAFDGQPDDLFGYSVSIDGDYAIVGAYLDDTAMGVNSGSAYIFKQCLKWIQQPNDCMGILIDDHWGGSHYAADDFLCTTTGPITNITLWGSSINDFNLWWLSMYFTLSIYSDIPDPDGTDPLYSMPGTLLWTKSFNYYGDYNQGYYTPSYYCRCLDGFWYEPYVNYFEPHYSHNIYQFDFSITPNDAFIQNGIREDPVVYWLVVYARMDVNGGFCWEASQDHWNDDAVYKDDSVASWLELRYPTGHPTASESIDMAFKIVTDTGKIIKSPNPPIIAGPASGKTDTEYTYTLTTTDPNGKEIYYYVDWGDETYTDWFGPFASGATATASHTWTEQGTYTIRAKAKNTYDAESEWSDPFSISMPKNKAINPFLLFLERLIERFPILEQILQSIYNMLLNL